TGVVAGGGGGAGNYAAGGNGGAAGSAGGGSGSCEGCTGRGGAAGSGAFTGAGGGASTFKMNSGGSGGGGGGLYGSAALSQLFLGSGGGGGGASNEGPVNGAAGASGGGIILILSSSVVNSGTIAANGGAASNGGSYSNSPYGGGGAGSGGSVLIRALSFNNAATVTASGGGAGSAGAKSGSNAGGAGGGGGGVGRVRLEADALVEGTVTPAPATEGAPSAADSDWVFFDNPAPADGTTLAATLLPNSDVAGSYVESDPTPSNPNLIADGQEGEWDFALDPENTVSGRYYLRMARTSGAPLTGYANLAIIDARVPPSAVDELAAAAVQGSSTTLLLSWPAPGDDGDTGTLLAGSSFYIQHATYSAVAFSTTAAQISLSTAGVFPGALQQYLLAGLSGNTTHYLRVWTADPAGNFSTLSNGATTATLAPAVSAARVHAVFVSSVTANWGPLPDAAVQGSSNSALGYVLEASTAADFSGVVRSSQTFGVSLSTLSVLSLPGGATYYFRVGSLNLASAAHYALAGSTYVAPYSAADAIVAAQSTGTWYSSSSFTFSSSFDGAAYYRVLFDANAGHAWTGSEARWDPPGTLTVQAATEGQNWHLHALPYDAGGVPGIARDIGPFWRDATPPGASLFRSYNSTAGALAEIQHNDLSSGVTVQVTISDVLAGLRASPVSRVVGFEDGVLPAGWTTGGDAAWAVQGDVVHAGTFAARSGGIAADQSTWLEVPLTTLGGGATFYRRVSSENGEDVLEFMVNGSTRGSWSGEYLWGPSAFIVAPGTATLRWRYSKNGWETSGADAAWLDAVSLPPVVAFSARVSRDGGATWSVVQTTAAGAAPYLALTGGDASTAAETLKILNLELNLSTNSSTCAAAAPCAATNQVLFVAEDMAGNIRESGPYAVIVATTPSAWDVASPFSTGAWYAGVGVPFESSFSSAAYYRYHWDTSAAHAWTGTEPLWSPATGTLTAPAVVDSKDWHLHVLPYNVVDSSGPPRVLGPFWLDAVGPAGSGFSHISSTGGVLGEAQLTALSGGATVFLTAVSDSFSGLLLSTFAVPGEAAAAPGGAGALYTNDGGASWIGFSSAASYAGAASAFLSLEVFQGRLYAGQGTAAGNGDVYACSPAATGLPGVCEAGDWALSGDNAHAAVNSLAVFQGRLYAGLGNSLGQDDIQVFDGASWTSSFDSNLGAGYGIGAMSAYKGKLYAARIGVQVGEGDVLVCDPAKTGASAVCDPADWSLSYDGGRNSFHSLAVFNGLLYAGQGNFSDAGDVYVCRPRTVGDPLACENGDWSLSRDGAAARVHALEAFGGRLYAAMGAATGQGDIYVCDPALTGQPHACESGDWSLDYDGAAASVSSLRAYKGFLYAGLGSAAGNGDILVRAGGAWKPVFDGLQENIYALMPFSGDLYAGQGDVSPDGVVLRLAPRVSSMTVTGADGTIAAQSASALIATLSGSTAATACGGAFPCSARNQVLFGVVDLAGSVSHFGPYALIVSTTPSAGEVVGPSTGTWLATSTMSFASPFVSAAYYRYVWDTSAAHTWTEAETLWNPSAGIALQAAPAGQNWYFHVLPYNLAGSSGTPRDMGPFWSDGAPPVASQFRLYSSSGGLMGESQAIDLLAGATVEIRLQDTMSGLLLSTGAFPGGPPASGGPGVVFSTDAGRTWSALGAPVLSYSDANNTSRLAVYRDRLYAGIGQGTSDGDVYACNPAATGNAATCETGDWSLSRNTSNDEVASFAVFNDRLYAGYGNDAGEGDVEVFDGTTWSVSYNGAQNYMLSLAEFRGRLYAAQAGATGAGDLLVCAPAATGDASTCEAADWSIARDGTGPNAYGLTVFNGALYVQMDVGAGLKLFACTPGATGAADVCDAGDWTDAGAPTPNGGDHVAHAGRLFLGGSTWIYACDPSLSGRAELCESGDWVQEYSGNNTVYFGRLGSQLYASALNTTVLTRSSASWVTVAGLPTSLRSLKSFNGRLYAGDAAADVYLLAPLVSSSTVTGADGSTALETLSAVLPTLANSTNTETCGGGYPCGATNQVAFTVMDAAGNARWAGPYAVIVATTPDAGAVSGPSTRAWVSYATFTFVSTFANASSYRRAWTTSPSHSWTESETLWNGADGPVVFEAAAPGTQYYLHVLPYNIANASGAPRALGPYRRDSVSPAFSAYRVVSSTGGLMGETQLVDLFAGVTVQIQVQDPLSGLHVATSASAGESPAPSGGFGVIYSTDGGASWAAFAAAASSATLNDSFESLAVFRDRLYAGQGYGFGDGDVYACDPALSGSPTDCETADWTLSRDNANYRVDALFVFNDRLYAGYGGTGGNGDIDVFDGTTWSLSRDGSAYQIGALAAYGGRLYAGQGDTSGNGDVLVCDPALTGAASSCESGDWSVAYDSSAYAATALVEFSGRLYAGFGSVYSNGAGDVMVFDGRSWTSSYDGALDKVNAFAVYGGRLYAAMGDDAGEGDILVCDPKATGLPAACEQADWSVSHDGATTNVESLGVFNGLLYAGVGGSSGQGDLLVFDGTAWKRAYDGTSQSIPALAAFSGRLYAGTSLAGAASVQRLTPAVASMTYTAAHGSTALETLSAVIPAFVDSQNAATCAGVAPCAATNQVLFAAGDLAANAIYGPYAVLVDTAVSANANDVVSIRSTGTWYATSSFTFSSSFAGAGYYRYVFDASATHAFNDAEPVWNSGILSTGPPAGGAAFYLHVKPFTLSDTAGATRDLGPFRFDPSTPVLSGFAALDLGGAPLAEGAPLRLASGVTVQISVQDFLSGLSTRPSLASDRFESGLPERWISTGPAAWYATADSANSGAFSLRAGTITHGQSTGVELVRRVRAGSLTFFRRVSSEADFDFLRFYIDGQLQAAWSGTVAWGQASIDVTAGTHTFRWSYVKDGTLSLGQDSAWIDDVVFPGSAYSVSYTTDAGASWRVAVATVATASPYVALTGNEGSTGLETLTAYRLDFTRSTSPATCAGSSPCAATNQVVFSAADRAENDSYGPYAVLVDTEAYPGCTTTRNVHKTNGLYTTITQALDSLPSSLTGHSCVVIRDGATYAEQVTVQNFTNNGSSITIMADPASGLRPVVSPPASSTAAFLIANASVNVTGLDVVVAESVPYGISASSSHVTLSSVTVGGGASLYAAGVRISSWSAVSGSSIAVGNAHGLWLDSTARKTEVSFSTVQAASASYYALYANGASSNAFTSVTARNPGGTAAVFDAGAAYNTISLSTMSTASGGYALFLSGASSNTIAGSYIGNAAGSAAVLDAGAVFNTISASTMASNSGAAYALYLNGASSNTITGSLASNPSGNAAGLVSGANRNTVVLSTMISAGVNRVGLLMDAASRNTVLQSYAGGENGAGAYISNASNFNAFSQSTFTSAAAAYRGLLLDNADFSDIAGCVISNAAGDALEIYGIYDTISLSTITAGGVGLTLTAASTVSVHGSYIQGSTAALISGSTGTIIGGSVFVATNTAGSALALAGGSVNLTFATSTLLAPSLGRGLALNEGNVGVVSLGSVTFAGAARGIEISTQGALFTLAVDSVTFRGLASGATAVHFLGGTFTSTFTLANFEDASVGANVSAAALDPASRITMNAHYGARTGQDYENDPNSLVYWEDSSYPGCVVTRNVGAGRAYATISAGVAALPSTLTGHSCVVIRDGATYGEQVLVEGFTMGGSSISIFTDPAVGSPALLDPPASSTAAFVIKNASVNVLGLDIRVDQNIPYGVFASSSHVQLSSVSVSTSGSLGIYAAGVRISSWSAVRYSSVTVWGAHGIWLDGSTMTVVSYSSAQAKSAASYALHLLGAEHNTVTGSYVQNLAGDAAYLSADSDYNAVIQSTMVSSAALYYGLHVVASDGNTVTGSYMRNLSTVGGGLHLDAGSDFNVISQSTMVADSLNFSALFLTGAGSNTVTGSYMQNLGGYSANLSGADGNTISLSTMVSNISTRYALYVNGSDSNTVAGSYIQNIAGTSAVLFTGSDYNTLSQSTMVSGGAATYALHLSGADWNAVTGCYAQNLAGEGARLNLGSDFNAVSLSTMIAGGAGDVALAIVASVSNTVTSSYMQNLAGYGAGLTTGANGNVITQSTMVSNAAAYASLWVTASDGNTVTGSRMLNPAGYGARLDTGADYNTVILSTMTSASVTAGRYGLYVAASSSNTILDSYVEGSTAAFISGSTGTVIGGSVFIATNTAGSALALAGGSVNLTLATSALTSPALGRGLALNPGNAGVVTLGSVTFSGAARGIEVSTQGALFSLTVDSVTFRGLSSGATAIHFLGGTFVSTITLANFEDATTGVNVSGAALDPASRVTMRAARGPRRGPAYENDPDSLVDWPELLPPSSPAIFTVGLSSVGVQYGLVNADGYVVEASTMADFSGVLYASATLSQAVRLAPQSLDPNTTYFLRTGALWGSATVYAQTALSTATLTKLASGSTVYRIDVTSMIVNWLPLALAPPDASSNSAAGYRLEVSTRPDFTPLWTSSQTPNVALSTLTVDSLRGEVTYYYRVGTINSAGAVNYAAAGSTMVPLALGVEMSTRTITLPGLTPMNATILITTSTVLTNTGNVKETYLLRVTTVTPGSLWTVGSTPGVDRYALWSLIAPAEPGLGDFAAEDRLADAEQACTAAVFALGGGTCVTVPVGGTRTLWHKIATPLATTNGAAQEIRIFARAVRDPDPDPNP
ncbi:MAG: right-handed parallel beta-helix repeat-containing protein, partial [Elusimicrobia bacterium]|nr:right-handed parallel beta-helix repeat-containing protein [Elusimicrobiota bacterium]